MHTSCRVGKFSCNSGNFALSSAGNVHDSSHPLHVQQIGNFNFGPVLESYNSCATGNTTLTLLCMACMLIQKENGGGECSHVPYTGAVCRDILKQRQYNCAFGGEEEEADIKISSAVNQLHDEELARVLNQSGISSVCLSALMPLACFYLFPFCNTTNGQSQTPSQEDCFTVVNGVCKKQMEVASEFIGEHLLNCLDFQEETTSNCSSKFHVKPND